MRTWAGWAYVAFIVDVFAQRIIGWNAATTRETELVDIPLRMAIWERDREAHPVVPGQLISHFRCRVSIHVSALHRASRDRRHPPFDRHRR